MMGNTVTCIHTIPQSPVKNLKAPLVPLPRSPNRYQVHQCDCCDEIQIIHQLETLQMEQIASRDIDDSKMVNKVVLIACGSFNPITIMHLRMFELARDVLQRNGSCKVIAGIISPVSDGYGKKGLESAKHRCAMIRQALKSSDWIKLDTWECEQENWSETVKILRYHKNRIETRYNVDNSTDDINSVMSPSKRRRVNRSQSNKNKTTDSCDYSIPLNMNDSGNVQLKLLCGADVLESFAVPGLWSDDDMEEIVSNFGLVCVTRGGSNIEKFIYESDILSKYRDNITIATEWITNDISSTKIRRSLRRNESVKYLLQDSVIDYINKHNLYSVPDNRSVNHITPSPNRDNAPDVNLPSVKHIQFLSPSHSSSNSTTNSPPSNNETSPNSGYSSGNELEDSDNSSPKNTPRRNNPGCMTDLSSIVRRVKRVALTPETCV
ncbi:nicotinamide/nicotinic acid mononucleotide adenylyltransferase 1-like [Tubulanus polymorphus]|uniref:nicotinamide/nicotinic acid mononucleotide adenylyltransferase 1-like n=1 Tax=Tubulanus polymorphus TaxID=672921 RepID=UPI003DA46C79